MKIFDKQEAIKDRQELQVKSELFGCEDTVQLTSNKVVVVEFPNAVEDPKVVASLTSFLDFIPNSDGSACVEMAYYKNKNMVKEYTRNGIYTLATKENVTSVAVSVMGPGDVRTARELIDRCTVEVSYHAEMQDYHQLEDKHNSGMLEALLNSVIITAMWPKTAIEVVVQRIHNNGNLFGATINALCLSLMHAAIPIKNIFAGTTIVVDSNSRFLVEPPASIEESVVAVFKLAYYDSCDDLLFAHATGRYTPAQLEEAITLGKQHCARYFNAYNVVFQHYYAPIKSQIQSAIKLKKRTIKQDQLLAMRLDTINYAKP